MASVEARLQTLLSNNQSFAKTWQNPWQMAQQRVMAKNAGGGLLILTCLDPRCVPEQYFGPNIGAGVIRNAGGRASKDVITSITALRTLVGVSGLFVVHHTDCGMTHMTDDDIRNEAKERTPDATKDIDAVESYGCFTAEAFEETIKEDVKTLRAAKALKGIEIRGFAFKLDDGLVKEVDV